MKFKSLFKARINSRLQPTVVLTNKILSRIFYLNANAKQEPSPPGTTQLRKGSGKSFPSRLKQEGDEKTNAVRK